MIGRKGIFSAHKKSETLSRIFESISETTPREFLITQISPSNLNEICHILSQKFRLGGSTMPDAICRYMPQTCKSLNADFI